MQTPLTVVHGPAGSGRERWVDLATQHIETIWLAVGQGTTAIDLHVMVLDALTVRGAVVTPELRTVRFSQGSTARRLARADQLGSMIGDLFDAKHQRADALVIDGLERLRDQREAMRFVESMVRAAITSVSTVLITETGSPFAIDRLRGAGDVTEVGFETLKLDSVEAEQRANRLCRLPNASPHHASDARAAVVELADGREVLLEVLAMLVGRLGPEARSSALMEVRQSSDRLNRSLELVLGLLSEPERELIEALCLLGDASIEELNSFGLAAAEDTCTRLLGTPLIRRARDSPHRYAPSHLIDRTRLIRGCDQPRVQQAMQMALGRGDIRGSLVLSTQTRSFQLLAQTLDRHGAALIDVGHGQSVLEAIDLLAIEQPEVDLAWLEGRAAHALGDADRALVAYERANLANPQASEIWRHGLQHYVRGDISQARITLDRITVDEGVGDPDADMAMVAALGGSAAWLMSDIDSARSRRELAFAWAPSSGAEEALAAAHTLAALVAASDGDRVANDWHYVKALRHAERAGDLWQVGRIRINRGSRLLEEGEYQAALVELDEAVRSADLGGYSTILAMALTNRGDIGVRVGRLDEARVDLQNAIDILQEQGSPRVAYPLAVLARLFVARGDTEQAIGACERALGLAERAGDRQATVSARVQLARALAERDPEAAIGHVEQALAEDEQSLDLAEAWVTMAVLAAAVDDLERAQDAARLAAEIARERRDRYSLAQAIEVAAPFQPEPSLGIERLGEASMIYSELGCLLDGIRVDVAMARLDPSVERLARVRAGADMARRLGARPLVRHVEGVLADRGRTPGSLEVNVLGSFSLTRAGDVVPSNAWQSRKARDLFKMLVTRRGRPITREQVIERLWPDDHGSAKASQKLSVALATLRSVLDPAKDFPAEHYVRTDAEAIRLDFADMVVDVDNFLSMAATALAEQREGRTEHAAAMLVACEAAYQGDVFEDDPYVDWHVSLREEARLVYYDVARALADYRTEAGELSDAVRLLLRILQRAPYDENTHLDLVKLLSRSGRHGDAHRAFGRYVEHMRELDIEPSSFPAFRAT